ncbi:MAG: hypothetical protein K0R03_1507 [Moraxellaceae bacterium]|jgi:hypothetical protein|nr:hypothetical protein [Moraxellaceae bacterium]
MNKSIVALGLAALLQSSMLLAAPAGKDEKGGTATPTAAVPGAASAVQVDVIGSQEAPTVFNVVPWKNKASMLPKKEVTTSILRETLQPLDPDVLRREIELQRRLGDRQ